MGNESTKGNNNQVSDIPIDVIINEIFQFVLVELKYDVNEFALFGYFGGDRTREIFPLFPCISLGVDPRTVIFDLRKLRYLKISEDLFSCERHFQLVNLLTFLGKNSPKMEVLEEIDVGMNLFTGDPKHREDELYCQSLFNFCLDFKFPNVKRFTFSPYIKRIYSFVGRTPNLRVNLSGWSKNPDFFGKLSSFEFRPLSRVFLHVGDDDLNFLSLLSSSDNVLKKLVLIIPQYNWCSMRRFNNQIILEKRELMTFPHLEHFHVSMDDFYRDVLTIRTGGKLKTLHCDGFSRDSVKQLVEESPKLEKIDVFFRPPPKYDRDSFEPDRIKDVRFGDENKALFLFSSDETPIFLPDHKTPLKHIGLEFVDISPSSLPLDFSVVPEESRFKSSIFGSKIESLTLRNLDWFETWMISQPPSSFRNLRSLELGNLKNMKGIDTTTLEFSPNLTSLILEGVLDGLSDKFFRTNHFRSLESLKLTRVGIIQGKGWRSLENLKELAIDECFNFSDHFFKDQKKYIGKTLEKLTIVIRPEERTKMMDGKWGAKFTNLRSIEIYALHNFHDLFSKNQFPALEEVVIFLSGLWEEAHSTIGNYSPVLKNWKVDLDVLKRVSFDSNVFDFKSPAYRKKHEFFLELRSRGVEILGHNEKFLKKMIEEKENESTD